MTVLGTYIWGEQTPTLGKRLTSGDVPWLGCLCCWWKTHNSNDKREVRWNHSETKWLRITKIFYKDYSMAVGKTYLTLVNDVLSRLRESEVTSVSDNTYSSLIGRFVNEAKREVEDAWNWNRLRSTITIDIQKLDKAIWGLFWQVTISDKRLSSPRWRITQMQMLLTLWGLKSNLGLWTLWSMTAFLGKVTTTQVWPIIKRKYSACLGTLHSDQKKKLYRKKTRVGSNLSRNHKLPSTPNCHK